jgi:hypothetical protein
VQQIGRTTKGISYLVAKRRVDECRVRLDRLLNLSGDNKEMRARPDQSWFLLDGAGHTQDAFATLRIIPSLPE